MGQGTGHSHMAGVVGEGVVSGKVHCLLALFVFLFSLVVKNGREERGGRKIE